MQQSHGDATRLIVEGVDPDKVTALIDEVVANGGVGERAMREDAVREDAVRMAMVNNFLGPKRFGKIFTDLALRQLQSVSCAFDRQVRRYRCISL